MLLLILLACLCLPAFYIYFRQKSKTPVPLPPGPPADPIIGHLRLIPPDNQHTLFYKWGKIYGDVIHLHFLGRSIIVLNSVQAAVDLLDKRSANYSDRPRFVIMEIMGWRPHLTFLPYGDQFQRHRRMFQQYLSPNECVAYQTIQTREAHVLLQSLLANGDGREDHIRRFSTAIVIQMGFGHQITSDDDPYVKITEGVNHAVSGAGSPGGTPIDFFPFLRHFPSWFPGTHYASFARDNKPAIDDLHEYPFKAVSDQMAEGKAKVSFLSTHLEALNSDGLNSPNTTEDIMGAAGTIYGAGADTVRVNTVMDQYDPMVLHPEQQARAQKEIDTVIGSGRLPELEDRPSLPYVEGILQETLRWNPAIPSGVPHRSLEDDIYNGMFIPKGSIVIPNTRGMTLDEAVYSDPFTFNPARFLPKPEGNGEPHPSGPFGFGRRICPGRHLAHASLWIAIASVLATLNISKAVDDDGKEITPEAAFVSGLTSHPYPYRSSIQPRNQTSRTLIAQSDISDTY